MASDTWSDADLAFVNGRVLTVNQRDDIVEAVAVVGNRIARVGSNESIKALVGNGTRVVDLAGRALTPGFVENHMHIINAVEDRKWIDVTPEVASSMDDIAAAVKKRVDETPAGELIVGWGFDHHRLRERRYPTRRDLDSVSPNHPVLLRQRESMSWTANTAALRLMGIQDDTPDPPGGPMLRDDQGAPLGPMWDNCRVVYIFPTITPPTLEELVDGYEWACQYLNGLGVTSVDEASIRNEAESHAWQLLRARGGLTARIYLNIYPVYGTQWDVETAAYKIFRSGMRTGFGDDWLRLGPAVIGIDGGVQGQTAALFEPYSNDPQGDVSRQFPRAPRKWRTSSASRPTRRASRSPPSPTATTASPSPWMPSKRPCAPTLARIRAIAWSTPTCGTPSCSTGPPAWACIYNAQPPILEVLGEACTIEPWGEQRSQYAFPVKSLLNRGVLSSGGSDMPIVTANPMVGIDCLVNRRLDPSPGGRVLNPDERLTVMEALRVYTYNGAYAHFEETGEGFHRGGQAGRPGRAVEGHPRGAGGGDPAHHRRHDRGGRQGGARSRVALTWGTMASFDFASLRLS